MLKLEVCELRRELFSDMQLLFGKEEVARLHNWSRSRQLNDYHVITPKVHDLSELD